MVNTWEDFKKANAVMEDPEIKESFKDLPIKVKEKLKKRLGWNFG